MHEVICALQEYNDINILLQLTKRICSDLLFKCAQYSALSLGALSLSLSLSVCHEWALSFILSFSLVNK